MTTKSELLTALNKVKANGPAAMRLHSSLGVDVLTLNDEETLVCGIRLDYHTKSVEFTAYDKVLDRTTQRAHYLLTWPQINTVKDWIFANYWPDLPRRA